MRGFTQIQPYSPLDRTQGGRVQVWAQVRAPAGNLSITSEGYFKAIEGFECKINGLALGAALRHRLGTMEGKHKHRSLCDLAAVAAGSCQEW